MANGSLTLNDGETMLWQGTPKPSVLGVWFFTKIIGFVVLSAFLTFWSFGFFGGMWAVATGQGKGFNPVALVGHALKFILPVCALAACAYSLALRRSYQYFVTNQRVVFIGGVLVKARRSLPYHTITDIEVSQSFLEQLLGLRSLNILTAGTSSRNSWGQGKAEIIFQGLTDTDTPERLVNTAVKSCRTTVE